MAHYYIDFSPGAAPPYGHSLPGAIGYVSAGGLTVLYGLKTRGDVQRQNHWPSLENIAPKVLERMKMQPTPSKPAQQRAAKITNDGANQPNNTEGRACAACGEKPWKITRHHLVPRQVGTDHRTIRLCLECHTEIHRLPNRHIATMYAAEQIAFINIRLPRTANFPPLVPAAPHKTKATHEAEGPPRDPVLRAMMKEAGVRRRVIKSPRTARNRHQGGV